jgi:hypothetical protein
MLVDVSSATTYPFASSGFWGDLKGAVEIKGLVEGFVEPHRDVKVVGRAGYESEAGSSPAERALKKAGLQVNVKAPTQDRGLLTLV